MKKYLFIIIAVLILVVGILAAIVISVTKEKNRISENYRVEVTGQMNELQTLTVKELKKYHSDITTELKKFGIRAGQVTNIVNVKYSYRDTLIRRDTLIYVYDTIKHAAAADFEITDKCFSIAGCVENSNIYITDYSHTDSILIALYKKRQCIFKKPTYKAIAISSCSGDTLQILNNIKIQK